MLVSRRNRSREATTGLNQLLVLAGRLEQVPFTARDAVALATPGIPDHQLVGDIDLQVGRDGAVFRVDVNVELLARAGGGASGTDGAAREVPPPRASLRGRGDRAVALCWSATWPRLQDSISPVVSELSGRTIPRWSSNH